MNDLSQDIPAGESASSSAATAPKFRPLRIWPALLLVVLMVLARYVPERLEGGLSRFWPVAMFGPLLCCVLMLVWWLTASRATWKERLFGLFGLIGLLTVTLALAHPTMRGPGTTYLTAPMGMILFALTVAGLAKSRPLTRTGAALLLAFLGFSFSALLRNEGLTGDYVMELRWRWSPSAEETMMASRGSRITEGGIGAITTNASPAAVPGEALAAAEWPGFRGADRSGRTTGPQIATDWAARPPRQLWKISVGPGWSSFAVARNFLYTQEQRGPMEAVVCYDAETGRELWKQQIEARLEDPMGGPGPRATPTLADTSQGLGLVVMGPTGILMRLNPITGAIVWQQDLKSIAGRSVPMWGFSSSPLVTESLAIVYAGGPGDKGLLAFDAADGSLRWSAAAGNDSYSSAQLNTIAGEAVALLVSNDGLLCVDPASGKVRLNYDWKFKGYRALQPTVSGDTVVIYSSMSPGTRALLIKKANGQLTAEEAWTSRNLKPDFTDFVAHQGFLYGIDGGFLTCVDLKTGDRKWKDGRYGKGQVVLLETSNLLLVLAEDGRIVLLQAVPTGHVEVAAFKALEGKTWNHPVLVGGKLYVRNSQEAACYQLPLAETTTAQK